MVLMACTAPKVPMRFAIKLGERLLISKVLSHHQAVDSAVHDADTHAAESWSQDVGAMPRRFHQSVMGDLNGWRERKVFTSGKEANIGFANPVKRRSILRCNMGEVPPFEHVS